MGDVVAFEDPANYRAVLRRIKRMLETGRYFIHPHASGAAGDDHFDDQDVIRVIEEGSIRPKSHSWGRRGWRYVVEGRTVDGKPAACVVELEGRLVVVTMYALKSRR